jgi:hypothetical protein
MIRGYVGRGGVVFAGRLLKAKQVSGRVFQRRGLEVGSHLEARRRIDAGK